MFELQRSINLRSRNGSAEEVSLAFFWGSVSYAWLISVLNLVNDQTEAIGHQLSTINCQETPPKHKQKTTQDIRVCYLNHQTNGLWIWLRLGLWFRLRVLNNGASARFKLEASSLGAWPLETLNVHVVLVWRSGEVVKRGQVLRFV